MKSLWILVRDDGYVLFASNDISEVEKIQGNTKSLTKIIDLTKFPEFINVGLYLPDLYNLA